jgi:hypothetical protein
VTPNNNKKKVKNCLYLKTEIKKKNIASGYARQSILLESKLKKKKNDK